MKIMYKYLLFTFLLVFFLNACDKENFKITQVELIVSSEMAIAIDPTGENEHPFLQVKEVGKDWNHWLMIHGITGFEYEPGYEYLLKVEKKVFNDGRMDLPFEYTLIEIISKTKNDQS